VKALPGPQAGTRSSERNNAPRQGLVVGHLGEALPGPQAGTRSTERNDRPSGRNSLLRA
jgi:hypothetical protein